MMADPSWMTRCGKSSNPCCRPPKLRRFRHPGRKPLDRWKLLKGILFVPKTGIQ